MSLSILLSTDTVVVEAGVSTPLTIEVVNKSEEGDRFELQVEGVDHEWIAVPVPIFTVGPGETAREKVFFNPARVSESLAGNYPFVVKVRSLNSGDQRTAQGVLQIKPYHHLSMEIVPKKGSVSPIRKNESFQISVMNLGNTEHTLQLYGSDPEDEFTFDFAQEQVNVGPGQQKDIEVTATPTSSRPFASPRLHGFSISGRSIQAPSVVCSSQAQIEQKPVISPGGLAVFVLFILLVFGWLAFMPKPPTMDMLIVDRQQAVVGDTIHISWRASNAKSVKISLPGTQGTDWILGPSGSRDFQATESGTIEAVAVRDDAKSKPIDTTIEVKAPPVVVAPKVTEFSIDPRDVNVGELVTVHYRFNESTVKATLVPTGQILDKNVPDLQVKIEQPGTTKFWIVVENANGKTAKSQQIRVRAVQASDASIVYFNADPTEADPLNPRVKISWQLTNAARAELTIAGKKTDIPAAGGEMNLDITDPTEVILTGYDAKGLTVTKRLSIKVKPVPPVPTTDGTTGATPPTTTGTNSTTGVATTTGGSTTAGTTAGGK